MARKDPETTKAYQHAWYLKHKERLQHRERERRPLINALSRQRYLENRADILKQHKEYRDKHPALIKERKRQSHQRNKDAINARRRQRRQDNPEKLRAQSRQSYLKYREKRIQYQKDYNAIPEKKAQVGARKQKYAKAHPEQRRRSKRKWAKAHPEQRSLIAHTRRARKRHAQQNDLTLAQWQEIKAHYGHRCVYCQRKMQRLTMDHITPLAKGGSHTVSNVVPACSGCNSQKNVGPPPVPVQPLLVTIAPSKKKKAS